MWCPADISWTSFPILLLRSLSFIGSWNPVERSRSPNPVRFGRGWSGCTSWQLISGRAPRPSRRQRSVRRHSKEWSSFCATPVSLASPQTAGNARSPSHPPAACGTTSRTRAWGKPWKSSHHLRERSSRNGSSRVPRRCRVRMGSPSTRTRSSFGRGSHSYDPGVSVDRAGRPAAVRKGLTSDASRSNSGEYERSGMAAFPPEGDAESDRVCRSRPRQYAPLGRLWGYARPHWPLILLGATLTFLGGATGLVQPLMAKYVIDSLEVGDPLTGPVLVLAIVVIGGAVVSAGGSFLLERTGQTVVLDVRRWLVGRLVRLKVTEVEQIKPGDLVSRLTADTTLLRAVVTNAIANAATSAILLVGAVLIMIYLDTWLFLVTTGLFLLVVLLMGIVLPRIGRATEASQAALGRMGSMLERI